MAMLGGFGRRLGATIVARAGAHGVDFVHRRDEDLAVAEGAFRRRSARSS